MIDSIYLSICCPVIYEIAGNTKPLSRAAQLSCTKPLPCLLASNKCLSRDFPRPELQVWWGSHIRLEGGTAEAGLRIF